MKKVGLYFGSFNPIHIGHLIIAEYFATQTDLDEVWLVVSPHNPLKDLAGLAPENDRLQMVKLAVKNDHHIQACDMEFNLPRPSYTCDTLRALNKNFPDYHFTLIMGEDNMPSFHQWKEYEFILENFPIRIFPRHQVVNTDSIIDWKKYDVQIVNAQRIEISSTTIRQNFHHHKSNRYLVSDAVIAYIEKQQLYL